MRCIDEELPFEVPENWAWARLEECCSKEIKRGKSPIYAVTSSVLVFAQKCNTKYDGVNLDLALFLDESSLSKYPQDEFMKDLDIVINSTGTGTLGRVGIYRSYDNMSNARLVPDSHVTVVRAFHLVDALYLYVYLKAMQPQLEKCGEGSTNQKELKANTIKELYIPLPPMSEQHRIVNTIDTLLSATKRIEKSLN